MGLSTNATFLDGKRGRALLENGLDFLVVSLDGASAESYEVMRPGGDFAATAANVRAFFALRRALPNHTQVVVQLIATAANRHEVRRFAEEWSAEGAQVMVKEARDWAGQVSLVPLGLNARTPAARTPCKMPWTELTVLWDGAVVPCANHYERDNLLGDLTQQSLDEIWNGPALTRLRDAHLADALADVRVCATCPRLPFDHADFIAVDQLAQRRRNYLRTAEGGDPLLPRPGLS